ncbi:hypothetical protein KPL47_09015 [Clostridium estertheticum]|uniref:hypothetical protein n=1 Tax=Clostridium estertheticum TaxID=238834 RepID=UPI001C0B4A3B|nr:hypothetical protein [Clostridium estertheticum]MBU3176513.1 hypothetical protein [Clostridium estertheticum]
MLANVKDEQHLKEVRESVEYIAFYQPMIKFKQDAGIRYYGKIKEWKEYRRGECTEIKSSFGTEDDIYLRINLEYVLEIDNIVPIQTGPRIVNYTTLYLLKSAESTQELKVGSSLELQVYKILKR